MELFIDKYVKYKHMFNQLAYDIHIGIMNFAMIYIQTFISIKRRRGAIWNGPPQPTISTTNVRLPQPST